MRKVIIYAVLMKDDITLRSNSTKSGMADSLFEMEPTFLIIDELEKRCVKDQPALGLSESRRCKTEGEMR